MSFASPRIPFHPIHLSLVATCFLRACYPTSRFPFPLSFRVFSTTLTTSFPLSLSSFPSPFFLLSLTPPLRFFSLLSFLNEGVASGQNYRATESSKLCQKTNDCSVWNEGSVSYYAQEKSVLQFCQITSFLLHSSSPSFSHIFPLLCPHFCPLHSHTFTPSPKLCTEIMNKFSAKAKN